MSRGRVIAWWLVALCVVPLAMPLALWARRRAVRLAPAAGSVHGLAGSEWPGEPLRLLLVGESTVAGVGVSCQQQALAGCLAQELAARYERPVSWRACGENGITAVEACERLLPQGLAEPADLVLLVFGVNDTTRLTGLDRWSAALAHLTDRFSAQGARVVLSAVPPLQHFSALPWLLRGLLGARAALLDERLRQVAQRQGAQHCPIALMFSPDFLAVDGYHPSALGYRLWAQGLAETITPAPPVS